MHSPLASTISSCTANGILRYGSVTWILLKKKMPSDPGTKETVQRVQHSQLAPGRERERERARGKMLGKYSKWHRQLKVGSIEQALREKCQTQVEPASSLHRY